MVDPTMNLINELQLPWMWDDEVPFFMLWKYLRINQLLNSFHFYQKKKIELIKYPKANKMEFVKIWVVLDKILSLF